MFTVIGKQIIPAFSNNQINFDIEFDALHVSEFFYDTIQGEGVNTGHSATFLRLTGCSLNCQWCDTTEVWRQGSFYSFKQLFNLMQEHSLIDKLRNGQHLILTGGSPLKQQMELVSFFMEFKRKYDFLPFIEIENECTLLPHPTLIQIINCWNNSPKLSNSGNSRISRYKPKILQKLSELPNSWFKFVVDREEDWEEIQMDFLDTNLIKKEQIILMPKGATKNELEQNREIAVIMAIQHNIRYCSREHIILWNKRTGI
jgi:organic radical activating enzyme